MPASPSSEFSAEHRARLLAHARDSIRHGLDHGGPQAHPQTDADDALRTVRASFVTLKIGGALRGCIGSIEARAPLIEDVGHNAWAAAFRDPRFAPLRAAEFDALEVHISVLTPLSPIVADTEAALLATLRPGIDGVLLQQGSWRSTFLPQVWEQLPEPADFLRQLRRKAGLPEQHDPRAAYFRYGVEAFGG
ncbi:AmmeMemoRadiSam system protein A [Fontimonas sp. SYSU GA230001]|uniref:AmmeMemoRadiSam system protein A n=1 Tax=Fontimonas sp. SYSU GA230001 TaxID=3142450 RepID=UPI0032B47CF3